MVTLSYRNVRSFENYSHTDEHTRQTTVMFVFALQGSRPDRTVQRAGGKASSNCVYSSFNVRRVRENSCLHFQDTSEKPKIVNN